MKARIAILLVVVAVVIGAAVLPSVFAGMTKMTFTKVYDIYDYFWVLEDMYATDRVDLNISGGCAGCHGAIQDQLNTSSIHSDFSCEECHKITKTSSGEEIEYSNQTHDLTIPRCLDCHGGNGTYSNDTGVEKQAPTATGFNESGYGTNSSAHKKFVEESLNFGFSKGENEACVSCHTNQLTEVTYKYFWNIEYSIEGWRISSLTYNGTREHTSNYTGSEEKHVFLSKNEVDCVGCHQNVYDTLVYGTNGTDEDYLSHAPIEINTNGGGTGWGDKNDCWNHLRYHYASNRAQNVNTEYCIECHKVDRYAEINGSDYYNLQAVINDTNSTSVHAAESLSCGTCHGSGKTKEVTCANHNSKDFVEHVSSTYARTVVGDICMGCHQAAVHPDNTEVGCNCHTSNTYVESVYIESEPSGLACNSRGKPCPTGPEAYFEWTPLYPQPNESVEFNASGSTDDGTIESYKWEFGDGNSTTVSDPTISHTYSSEGDYVVNLTVTDDTGFKDTYTDTVNVSAAEKAWVYQEDANSTSCSGSWFGGDYSCSNTYDGDWDTSGRAASGDEAYVYFNYTKPSSAIDAKWKVKDEEGTINLSISSSCWSYYSDKIRFKVTSKDGALGEAHWYCYNSTWHELRTTAPYGGDNIFEEAIWWWK